MKELPLERIHAERYLELPADMIGIRMAVFRDQIIVASMNYPPMVMEHGGFTALKYDPTAAPVKIRLPIMYSSGAIFHQTQHHDGHIWEKWL